MTDWLGDQQQRETEARERLARAGFDGPYPFAAATFDVLAALGPGPRTHYAICVGGGEDPHPGCGAVIALGDVMDAPANRDTVIPVERGLYLHLGFHASLRRTP